MHPFESYLREIRDIRYSGAAVQETSYYGPLATLLNEVGRTLRPRVQCFISLQNRGAGIPDGGFFTADQLPRGAESEALPGQLPARGAAGVGGAGAAAGGAAQPGGAGAGCNQRRGAAGAARDRRGLARGRGSLHPEAGDLEVAAGWGIAGRGGITMPGKGRTRERDYAPEERAASEAGAAALGLDPEDAFRHLGARCLDVYLNDRAYWRCVPARVWKYTLGGYQVIKKWLSYRERPLLGRALKLEEVREVWDIARRIAAILLLEPALDAGYGGVKGVEPSSSHGNAM